MGHAINKMILTAALSGSRRHSGRQPAQPIPPQEIAVAAKEACEAGASVMHVPMSGTQRRDATRR